MCRLPLVLAVLALATPALAQVDPASCQGFEIDQDPAPARLAVVTGEGKANFVKNPEDAKACPAEGAACAKPAFLLAGDQVAVSREAGAFACVDYVSRKGQETSGWFPKARLQPAPATPVDWLGTWRRDTSASVTFRRKGKAIALHGDATWGEGAGTHVGEIAGTVEPAKADAAFTVGERGNLPFKEGDEFDCRVQLKQLGPYLLVQDNSNCGGANVRFTGVYVRR